MWWAHWLYIGWFKKHGTQWKRKRHLFCCSITNHSEFNNLKCHPFKKILASVDHEIGHSTSGYFSQDRLSWSWGVSKDHASHLRSESFSKLIDFWKTSFPAAVELRFYFSSSCWPGTTINSSVGREICFVLDEGWHVVYFLGWDQRGFVSTPIISPRQFIVE